MTRIPFSVHKSRVSLVFMQRLGFKMAERGTLLCAWKFISQGLVLFLENIWVSVRGDGMVWFWRSLGRTSKKLLGVLSSLDLFHRLYNFSLNSQASIKSLASWTSSSNYSWNLSFMRDLNDWKRENLVSILSLVKGFLLSRDRVDPRIWNAIPWRFCCKSSLAIMADSPSSQVLCVPIIRKMEFLQKLKNWSLCMFDHQTPGIEWIIVI